MGILNLIKDKEQWDIFYQYKAEKGHLTKAEKEELSSFIMSSNYLKVLDNIRNNIFSIPTKKLINKMGSEKKRTVYYYKEDENMVLKFITFHLSKYDEYMSPNCYSFRKNYGVKRAIDTIVSHRNIKNMYCYKVDIKNYFNSIDIEQLLVMLNDVIDDNELLNFLTNLLTLDKSTFEGNIIEEKRGAMAGVPFSPFLANVYLKDLDTYFYNNNILYARYSDDIIVFANTKEELDKYIEYIHSVIKQKHLEINKDKEFVFNPGDTWNFLGIKYTNGRVDLSDVTIEKIKGKIRRKARAIHRWKIRKNADDERAIKAMIRSFNYKFFESKHSNDLTWSRWFFPLINTDKGLNEVDQYLQYYLRYISTGKHNKSNYNVRYKELKDCKYKSLVNEYYKMKKSSI